jgi:hypothetical protein
VGVQDNEVGFCLLTLRLTLQDIPDQPRFIFMSWKGPDSKPMDKVQCNQKHGEALKLLAVRPPNRHSLPRPLVFFFFFLFSFFLLSHHH